MLSLLKDTDLGIPLFFSLCSMHDKIGKCVNGLWFFYLGEDF